MNRYMPHETAITDYYSVLCTKQSLETAREKQHAMLLGGFQLTMS